MKNIYLFLLLSISQPICSLEIDVSDTESNCPPNSPASMHEISPGSPHLTNDDLQAYHKQAVESYLKRNRTEAFVYELSKAGVKFKNPAKIEECARFLAMLLIRRECTERGGLLTIQEAEKLQNNHILLDLRNFICKYFEEDEIVQLFNFAQKGFFEFIHNTDELVKRFLGWLRISCTLPFKSLDYVTFYPDDQYSIDQFDAFLKDMSLSGIKINSFIETGANSSYLSMMLLLINGLDGEHEREKFRNIRILICKNFTEEEIKFLSNFISGIKELIGGKLSKLKSRYHNPLVQKFLNLKID